MPQFKRFVAYLYYYENDTKEYLAGFARVEMRGGICRLEIHLKGTEYAGQEGKVSLFIRREGKILAFPVGNMRLMSKAQIIVEGFLMVSWAMKPVIYRMYVEY